MIIVFNTSPNFLIHGQDSRSEALKGCVGSSNSLNLGRALRIKQGILRKQGGNYLMMDKAQNPEKVAKINREIIIGKVALKIIRSPVLDVDIKGESNHSSIESKDGDNTVIVSQNGKNSSISIYQNNQNQNPKKDENKI